MALAPAAPSEDALGKAFDARLMRRLLRYVRPYRRLVTGALALLFLEGTLQVVGPLLTRRVIDVALPAGDVALVQRSVLLFLVALVAGTLCGYQETLLTSFLGQQVMRDLRIEILTHLQRLPIAFFDRTPVGRLVTRLTSDVEALNEMFTAGVVAGLGDLFTLVAISIAMLLLDWRLALAAFAVIPLVLLTSLVFRAHVRDSYREIRVRLARINAFLHERLSGMRIVQLFGQEGTEARRFNGLNRDHLDAHLHSIHAYALYFPVIELLTSIALATLIVASAGRVGATTLTVGTVAAFLQYARRFFQPLQDLSDVYNIIQGAMAASERVFALLDTPAEAEAFSLANAPGEQSVESRGHRPVTLRGPNGVRVEFEDVWFAYGRGGAGGAGDVEGDAAEPLWVLRGVSFVAAPGQTVAVVGHTGAGKTTIINLLLRFYEPQRGRILVNGVDIRAMPRDTLRAHIGYVQQDIFLFAGDIASNLRLSSRLTHDELMEAARLVGADRVIARLPGALRHELGERGASLSLGERQLLSFARAIAADPALLVLDEATSAVDSELEAAIQEAIGALMRGRTTIAIAHRLSTVARADAILVLHHGVLVEQGTHDSLMAGHGLYERLYRLQTGDADAAAAIA